VAVNADDHFRLALEWSMPELQSAYNILGLTCESGTSSDAAFLTSAASWVTTAFATVQGIIHNQVDIEAGIINQVTWSGTEWVVSRLIGTILPTFTATDANDMLPHAVAGVITFPTATPRKWGRVFVPGLSEVQQADSLLIAGAATALANLGTALMTAFTPGSASCRYAVLGKGGNVDLPTALQVNGLVGSQDRRKPGVGI
jgi:hypothetical protein